MLLFSIREYLLELYKIQATVVVGKGGLSSCLVSATSPLVTIELYTLDLNVLTYITFFFNVDHIKKKAQLPSPGVSLFNQDAERGLALPPQVFTSG